MSISKIAFGYRRLVLAIVGALMVYGVISYFTLKAREDPKVTMREAVITTAYPGLPSERVELLITKTLEEAIIEMPEVEEIRSTSLPGMSIIHVEAYDRFFELDQIWDDLRQQIDTVRDELPEGTHPPQVNDTFGDVAVITLALTAPSYNWGEKLDLAQHVRDLLYEVKGMKEIQLLGVQEERIFMEYSATRLASYGLDPEEIVRFLASQNIIRPGGTVDSGNRSIPIEPTGNFSSIEELREALIQIPGQEDFIPLQDLLTVRRGPVDPRFQPAYFNGKPAIILSITMMDESDVIDFSAATKAKVNAIAGSLPPGVSLDFATFQAEQVENAVYGVSVNVLQSLGIVLVVVILFLGMRTGLIVGAIVPTVMLITLSVMNFTGINLERMSLATLIISLGLLVDNGIVIAEDFVRRLEDGASRDDALAKCGKELAIPLATSSLTTVLVFLPLMLAETISGEYTRSISLVILISLTTSWFVALTVTPTLCYYFAKAPARARESAKVKKDLTGRIFEIMGGAYRQLLVRTMRHRLVFLGSMVLLLLLSVVGMRYVPQQFFPESDREQILVYVDLPPTASMDHTDKTVKDMLDFVLNQDRFPHIRSGVAYVGFGGPRFVLPLSPFDPATYKGFMVLNIEDLKYVLPTVEKLREEILYAFPEVEARVSKMFLGPIDPTTIDIQVKGPDPELLYQTALTIENLLYATEDVIEIRNDWEGRHFRFRINVDQDRARRAGVSSTDVSLAMERYFSGQRVTEYREGDELFPVILRAKDNERHDLNRIRTIPIYSKSRKENIPLVQVADIEIVTDFLERERENLMRTITVQAKNPNISAQELQKRIAPHIQKIADELPLNHRIEYDGVVAQSAESRAAITKYLPACIGAIFITLIWQFNSFRRTGIIFITLPLLLIGAVLGLYLFQAQFGFMVLLGLYALAGILANNAIVLIDRIDIERAEGDSSGAWEAVISASVRRLRPIIMSTTTTVLGLLPLIVFTDVLFYGMAAAIAVGLAVGTVLTLGVVPVLYTYFFNIKPREKVPNV